MSLEGESWDKKYGTMRGVSLIFVATLASGVIANITQKRPLDEALEQCIKKGLSNSQEFIVRGYGYKDKNPEFYDSICKSLFESGKISEHIECSQLPFTDDNDEPDPFFWSILKERTENKLDKRNSAKLEDVALAVVREGRSALKNFPSGHFKKLITVDRAEIESYRSMMSIMKEYINSKNTTKPLSIAVFGYPGSGKSFGITQVAESIDSERIEAVTFNISQFISIKDLSIAFHKVRDISLKGKIPLVFFDEFDCKYEGQFLGWLPYFLVPMQDGKFMDCGVMHPIGKSIFVFAGGVFNTFQEFCSTMNISSLQNKSGIDKVPNEIIAEKCPDFISRLRGYVNILGPNQIKEKKDEAYILRRAILLRSLIEEKAPYIIEKNSDVAEDGIAHIDDSLLRALIRIPKYKHGVRSMQAIIEMSMLGENDKSWDKASLPPKEQLELHVDGKEFSRLLAQK